MSLARAAEAACITKHRDYSEMKLLPEAGGENRAPTPSRGSKNKGCRVCPWLQILKH